MQVVLSALLVATLAAVVAAYGNVESTGSVGDTLLGGLMRWYDAAAEPDVNQPQALDEYDDKVWKDLSFSVACMCFICSCIVWQKNTQASFNHVWMTY